MKNNGVQKQTYMYGDFAYHIDIILNKALGQVAVLKKYLNSYLISYTKINPRRIHILKVKKKKNHQKRKYRTFVRGLGKALSKRENSYYKIKRKCMYYILILQFLPIGRNEVNPNL